MYEAFFSLSKRPFSATPDSTCCFVSEATAGTLQSVQRQLNTGDGIVLLTAPAGMGKTLLCRKIAADFAETHTVAYVGSGNFPTRRALLQNVLYEFGLRYSGLGEQELRLELTSSLRNALNANRPALLILDEAHLLTDRLLEEVRGLADSSNSGRPLVRILLAAQTDLEERLTGMGLQALNQRISLHAYVDPLTMEQSCNYVEYRLRWAGGDGRQVFSLDALRLIAQVCDGLPRCINQLCDHSLLLAFVAESQLVTRQLVEEALSDLKQLPLHWNEPLTASNDASNDASNELSATDINPQPAEHGFMPESMQVTADFDSEDELLSLDAHDAEQTTPVNEFADQFPDPSELGLSASIEIGSGLSLTQVPDADSMMVSDIAPPPRVSQPSFTNEHRDINPIDMNTIDMNAVETNSMSMNGIDESAVTFGGGVVPLLSGPRGHVHHFEEESVEDRYARLDASGRTRGGYGDARRLAGMDLAAAVQTPVTSVAEKSTAEQLEQRVAEPIAATAAMLPPATAAMLPAAAIPAGVRNVGQGENTEIVAAAMFDEISVSEAVGPVPDSVTDFEFQPEDLESAILAELRDICMDVQNAIAASREETAAAADSEISEELIFDGPTTAAMQTPQFVAEPTESTSGYDIIEPDSPNSQSPRLRLDGSLLDDPAMAGSVVPKPNYKSIFSLLRRKQGKSFR